MAELLQNYDTLMKFFSDINKCIKRYEKFPPETRFLMLIDKIQMSILVAKLATTAIADTEITKTNKNQQLSNDQKSQKIHEINRQMDEVAFTCNLIEKEFNALEEYIQSDTKSILNNMEKKLDAVLQRSEQCSITPIKDLNDRVDTINRKTDKS